MKFILSIVIIIFNFTICLAQSRLNVKAADSLDFVLSINDVKANNTACLSITIDKLPAGKLNVSASIPSHPEINISQVLTLKKNSSAFYEIEKNKGVYKFVLKSESTLQISESTISPEPSEVLADDKSVNAAPASLESAPSENPHSNGCQHLTDSGVYEKMLQEVQQSLFENKKLEIMKNFSVHHCVRVEQLRYMMSRLSLEDNKIILLKEAHVHVFDPSNLKLVEADFFLEKNKARVHALISEHP